MDWLARWALDRPVRTFLVDRVTTIDFATAHQRISRLAGGIRHRFEPGSRLGVVMQPRVEDVLVAMAVPVANMVLVPLPVAAHDDERRVLSELADLDAVVGPGDIEEAEPVNVPVDPHGTHVAVFTSGSSGVPRAVRLTGANIEASAAASAAHLDHRPEDRWLAVLPLHHVGGLSIVWRSARQGSTAVLDGPFEADRVAGMLTDGTVSLASFVSTMLEGLDDIGLAHAPGFRLGLVGGGPPSRRALNVGGMRLLTTYGMTETASQVATADPADPRPDRLVVLDGARVTIDEVSRIVIDGPMVSPGDLDAADRQGPLVTNDLGRLHSGRLEVMGRGDNVIVTGGENVMAERVERIAASIAGAGDVAVVGLPDERWGSIVAAVYTGPASADELDRAMRNQVAKHEVPRRWLQVEAVPTLGIGKVDRRGVAGLFD